MRYDEGFSEETPPADKLTGYVHARMVMVSDESQRDRLDFSSRLRTEDTEGTCIGTAPKCVNCSRPHPTGACNTSRTCGCEARQLEERGLHYVADAGHHKMLAEIAGSEVLGGTQLKRESTP